MLVEGLGFVNVHNIGTIYVSERQRVRERGREGREKDCLLESYNCMKSDITMMSHTSFTLFGLNHGKNYKIYYDRKHFYQSNTEEKQPPL